MRVISGKKRGTSLFALQGNHTRPTTDRVKEAMFSIINFYLPKSLVLDLFSGSGALGIEALSRGADKCVFVENDRAALGIVKKNIDKTGFIEQSEIVMSDYCDFLKNTDYKFDIILLDPPYNCKMCDNAMQIIYDRGLLNDGGLIVCETDCNEVIQASFNKKKDYKYGNTKLSVFINGELI